MNYRFFLLFLFVIASVAPAFAANDPAAEELFLKVQRSASPNDESVEMKMTLFDGGSVTSRRRAVYLQCKVDGAADQNMRLIRFSAPPEMDGSAVLTIERSNGPDDQWLYLPAYHTSRKIPSSNRSDRYMGTDFYYEDVSDDKVSEHAFIFAGEEVVDGRRLRIIEQTPEDALVKRESAYGRKLLWMDPERLLMVRMDLYDKDGNLIKRLENSRPVQVGTTWRWDRVEMNDLRISHRTLIEYENRKTDAGLSPQVFTVRSLERSR